MTLAQLHNLEAQTLTPAYKDLEKYLRHDFGQICTVQIPDEDKLVVRLERARHKDFRLTSSLDAGRCFTLLVMYLIRNNYISNYIIRPLDIVVAYGDKKYRLEHIMPQDETSLSIPKSAPEKWPGKRYASEEIEVFFARVWAKYIPVGLDSVALKKLDPKLWKAIQNFPAQEKRPWPEEFRLSTTYARLSTALERFEKFGWDALSEAEKTSVLRKQIRDGVRAATGTAAEEAERPSTEPSPRFPQYHR